MTDPDLLTKKLAWIAECVREITQLGRPELFGDDVRERRFVEHTLQVAIQAAIDIASHVVSDERLGEPRDQRDHFRLLRRAGWIESDLSERLERMVGFRNVVVHGYQDVDLDILRKAAMHDVHDLAEFAKVIRARVLSD